MSDIMESDPLAPFREAVKAHDELPGHNVVVEYYPYPEPTWSAMCVGPDRKGGCPERWRDAVTVPVRVGHPEDGEQA